MDAVEFRILGPLQVRVGGRVSVGRGHKRRVLLAVLLLSANRTVPRARIIQALWGEDPPRSAVNLVHGYVRDWRAVLDSQRRPRSTGERLVTSPEGYRLVVTEDEFDLLRFEGLVSRARECVSVKDLPSARRFLVAALAERRGPALADLPELELADAATALEEAWLSAVELTADVELSSGRPEQALAVLDVPAHDHPLRESIAARRILALYRAGRQSESLTLYDRTRSTLVEVLGVEPGPDLRTLRNKILTQDPSLGGPTTRTPTVRLPSSLSSFVGRRLELAQLVEATQRHRLVTLTGPAGCGKTRLGIEAARTLAAAGDRDVAFVDLAPVREAEVVWPTVAAALGMNLAPHLRGADSLALQLGERPVLLLMDNMEQLVPAAADLEQLLSAAPGVAVLVTSRQPLHLPGEQVVHLHPLPIPARSDSEPGTIRDSDAVQLFVDRARACDPAFSVTDTDAGVVARICRSLDGLPLALELAAPWTSTLSLAVLLERLDRPLRMLGTHVATSERSARHRTLHAAIDWSCDSLSADQRALLANLSVFRATFELTTIEQVAGVGKDTLQDLAVLVDRNLVQRTAARSGTVYRLLATIREYAAEQLARQPSEQAAVLERLAHHVCQLAEQAARHARTQQGEAPFVALGEQQADVRQVLDHLQHNGQSVRLLALVIDCLPLWWDLGHVQEGFARLTDALAGCPPNADAELLAAAHAGATMLADSVGEPVVALEHARESGRCAARAHSASLEMFARCLEGNSLTWMDWAGPATKGLALLQQVRESGPDLPEHGLRWGWAARRSVVAQANLVSADFLRYREPTFARTLVNSIRDESLTAQDDYLTSFIVRLQGALDADAGLWGEAEQRLQESLDLVVRMGFQRGEARSVEELALLAWAQGELEAAARLGARATQLGRESGHVLNWARCAARLSEVSMEQNDLDGARLLIDQSEAAVLGGYPDIAARAIGPRRARLARLSGQSHEAVRQLRSALLLQDAYGLTPDRVVYVVESALAAAAAGRAEQARSIAGRLTLEAERLGLRLPAPELARIATL
ncbi:ATP-binding protein [Angustibacter sp. McL0619]|uniref:ATP-binding protein n=1 Tax=Angustibacter sp. McL0619 TaxID=3415676 RepID=UPI003CEA5259